MVKVPRTQGSDSTLVDALLNVWQGGPPLNVDSACRLVPANDDEAYAVQKDLGARLGWWPSGRPQAWKLGGTEPAVTAPVPDACLMSAPARLGEADRCTLFGVEVELVIQLASPLAAGCRREDAAEAVGEVIAAIEVFDVRAEGWQQLPRTFLLADLQMHGRLILGKGISGPWRDEFSDSSLSVLLNEKRVTGLSLRHPEDDPLILLPWLAGHVERCGWGLEKGDLISTGSWVGMFEIGPGDKVVANFEGIGGVSLEIAKATD